LVGIVSGYSIPKNTPILSHLFNKNSIDVSVDEGIDLNKINIELSINSTDYENVDIFKNGSAYTIPKEYGENDWNLSYDEMSFGALRHFKTNSHHEHHYSSYFYENEGILKCDIKIVGPDEASYTVELKSEI
jgi:hypothetical protein